MSIPPDELVKYFPLLTEAPEFVGFYEEMRQTKPGPKIELLKFTIDSEIKMINISFDNEFWTKIKKILIPFIRSPYHRFHLLFFLNWAYLI